MLHTFRIGSFVLGTDLFRASCLFYQSCAAWLDAVWTPVCTLSLLLIGAFHRQRERLHFGCKLVNGDDNEWIDD